MIARRRERERLSEMLWRFLVCWAMVKMTAAPPFTQGVWGAAAPQEKAALCWFKVVLPLVLGCFTIVFKCLLQVFCVFIQKVKGG